MLIAIPIILVSIQQLTFLITINTLKIALLGEDWINPIIQNIMFTEISI